jgi:hypothetical protein
VDLGLTLRTTAIGVAAALLLTGGCSDDGSTAFCDRVAAVRRLESLGQDAIDVDDLRDLRRELAGIEAEPALRADVDTMIAIVDLVIDRFGDVDLEHPTARQLERLQAAQQELESRLLDAEVALAHIHDAAAAC